MCDILSLFVRQENCLATLSGKSRTCVQNQKKKKKKKTPKTHQTHDNFVNLYQKYEQNYHVCIKSKQNKTKKWPCFVFLL